jgi:7-cyano-7-deazaguanine synthase
VKKAVILLSGGLDSATCAAIARNDGYDIYALTFRYGQRHGIEINYACKLAEFFAVKQHKIIDIDTDIFKNSSLTGDCGGTYVPARNTLFLSYALAFAESILSHDIFIGVTCVDYSGYPDCRPDYIEQYQKMANLATQTAREGNPIIIHAPLLHLSKRDIILIGHKLGVDYELTHSCYFPTTAGLPCGKCDSCIHRQKGFSDTIKQQVNKTITKFH